MTDTKNPAPKVNAVPVGWKLVPIKADVGMIGAWYRYKNGHRFAGEEPARDTSDVGAWAAMLASAPTPSQQAKEPSLDWSNFEGPKRNVDWKPDDQDLIYTAINFRDGEWGDADEDAGQQIVERLLSAWNRAAASEEITFEIAARLLKERDQARAALKSAVAHIEHMAAWFSNRGSGYSFESLGEDMPGIEAAHAAAEGSADGR